MNQDCCKDKCECFSLEGDSGELYLRIPEEDYEEIKFIEPTSDEDDSHIALSLSSVDRTGRHVLLTKFLNKKVKITIKIIEEDVQ